MVYASLSDQDDSSSYRHPDLDPFSSTAANQIIKAKRIITEKENGFTSFWSDTPISLFINCPGGKTGKDSNVVLA